MNEPARLTPVINAIATVQLVISFTSILIALKINGAVTKRALNRAGTT